jgi:predicted transcriptional regulator
MLAQYNPAAVISRRLEQRKISGNFFGPLVGVNPAILSQYLTGKKNLPAELAQAWLHTLDVIDELVERAKPLPLNHHPNLAPVFKKILEDFDKQLLLVSVVSLAPGTDASDEVAQAAVVLDKAITGGLATLANNFIEVKEDKENGNPDAAD